jgi:hypothetical protein
MMSQIYPNQTIYYTAIIFLLLSFVLLSFKRVGYALSYWDAIFEIGFNPESQEIDPLNACRQIERLVRLRKAVHELPIFDKELDNKIREVEARISSFDAGNLDDPLPFSDSKGEWRRIGIRGGVEHDHYKVAIVDPGIENWLNSSSNGIPKLWRPQEQFDIVGRININAIKKDLPHIGKLLVRLKAMLNFKAAVFDALSQPVITMEKYLRFLSETCNFREIVT